MGGGDTVQNIVKLYCNLLPPVIKGDYLPNKFFRALKVMMVSQASLDARDYQGFLVMRDREGHEDLRVRYFFLSRELHEKIKI